MSHNFFDNAEELFRKFFPDNKLFEYTNYTVLSDEKVGFSVQREYPGEIRYFPTKKKNCSPDTVAIIHVVYKPSIESDENIKSVKVPLIITISLYNRYLSNRLLPNFNDAECPTKESIEISEKTLKPGRLTFYDDFYYDHNKDSIVDKNDKIFTGRQVLDYVFNRHLDTIHWRKGFILRTKIKLKRFVLSIVNYSIKFLKFILKNIFGRILKSKEPFKAVSHGYKKDEMIKIPSDEINIKGIKTSKMIAIVFSLIVLTVYLLSHLIGFKSDFWNGILSNKLLLIIFIILSITTLDVFLPNIILILINVLIKIQIKLEFKPTKF